MEEKLKELSKYEKFLLEHVSDLTNRSLHQTTYLYQMCDYDFDKLMLLEEKIKNTFTNYCPGDKEEMENVLQFDDKTDYFLFENMRKRYLTKKR